MLAINIIIAYLIIGIAISTIFHSHMRKSVLAAMRGYNYSFGKAVWAVILWPIIVIKVLFS
jgi:uncharacterized membrane protein YraQ (UPF0718 family)